jgi:hypothetical protein
MDAWLAVDAWGATCAFATAIASGAHALACVPPLARRRFGPSGLARAAALRRHAWLRALDPSVRQLAALIGRWPLEPLRSAVDRLRVRAGDRLGLCSDEWLALAMFGALCGACCGLCVTGALVVDRAWPTAAAVALGASYPFEYLRNRAASRASCPRRSI